MVSRWKYRKTKWKRLPLLILERQNTKTLEEITLISIHPDYPDRHVMIGTELTEELRSTLVEFLKKKYDIFEWSQGDC